MITLPGPTTFFSGGSRTNVCFLNGGKKLQEGFALDSINKELAIELDFGAKSILSKRKSPIRIELQDILTLTSSSDCSLQRGSSLSSESSSKEKKMGKIGNKKKKRNRSNNEEEEGDSLSLHYVDRSLSSNRWRLRTLSLKHEDCLIQSFWLEILTQILEILREDRPRRLLVFVNPFGGLRRAGKVFNSSVEPVLKLMHSEISYEVVITQYKNHASDLVATKDLSRIEGIVAVGGDGLFNEIVDALLKRQFGDIGNGDQSINSDKREHTKREAQNLDKGTKNNLRIGVIPAGSTNSMALTLHGTTDVTTAVLHILVGDRRRIDVSSVFLDDELKRFSVALMSHGYFGEIIERSEQFRWLGPKRYELSGLRTWIGNRGYSGSILLKQDNVAKSQSENLKRIESSSACTANCDICIDAVSFHGLKSSHSAPSALAGCSERTKVIRGRFLGVTCCTNAAHSQLTRKGLAPGGHLGDGMLELIVVHKTTRLNYIRYLYRTAFHLSSPYALPFVERFRVKEFAYAPNNLDEDGVWNLDGELFAVQANAKIRVKANCQLLSVFGRGPEYVN